MTTHEVAVVRTFSRRKEGEDDIGTIRLTGKAELSIDGKELPSTSVEYLMTFALQSLQDAYAGKESHADAKEAFEAKLARVIDGTIGTRGGGTTVSDETKIGREIVRDKLRAKGGEAWKAYKEAADAEARAAILDAIIAKNADAIAKLVEAERKRRAALKRDASAMELDI